MTQKITESLTEKSHLTVRETLSNGFNHHKDINNLSTKLLYHFGGWVSRNSIQNRWKIQHSGLVWGINILTITIY